MQQEQRKGRQGLECLLMQLGTRGSNQQAQITLIVPHVLYLVAMSTDKCFRCMAGLETCTLLVVRYACAGLPPLVQDSIPGFDYDQGLRKRQCIAISVSALLLLATVALIFKASLAVAAVVGPLATRVSVAGSKGCTTPGCVDYCLCHWQVYI
jgi:hypothetical protein